MLSRPLQDLFFTDCTVPSKAIVARFLDVCYAEPGAVAVHCRAGLVRTGTLIAVWLMRRAGFTAAGAIGWLRIVRPGSVIGP
jgi:cell division cycle 14